MPPTISKTSKKSKMSSTKNEESAGAAKPAASLGARASRARVRRVREKLLAWYDVHRRDLPWRRSRDPYAIWVSETMLQQTRVETVIPYYERFLASFPDVGALASADRDEVFQHWAGLGYYSRARNLHEAARKVVDEFAGSLPDDAETLRELPGVGRYTAGALASIAFDRPEAIVDGNVKRVLCRVLGIRQNIARKEVEDRLWEEAGALARGSRPGDLNQAIMELGATCCTPRSPACGSCPLARSCDARRVGDAESLPIKSKRKKPERVAATAAWLPRRGSILALRRPPKGLLADMWELPGGDVEGRQSPAVALDEALRDRVGLRVSGVEAVGVVEHIFTHRHLQLHVFRCAEVAGRVRLSHHAEHRWIRPEGFAELPHAALMRKAMACFG